MTSMVESDYKMEIDPLEIDELRVEAEKGNLSRFQRHKFAYLKARLAKLEGEQSEVQKGENGGLRHRIMRFLRDPGLQGVSAIAAVIAVALTVYPLVRLDDNVPGGDQTGTAESLRKLDDEIRHRLEVIPLRISKSKAASSAVAKGNLTSSVFELANANQPKSVFLEFNDRTLISLVFSLKSLVIESEKESVEKAYVLLSRMKREAIEKYYVHDMYKMSPTELKNAEDTALSYYASLIRLRPAWK